jgi:hypothetical protein
MGGPIDNGPKRVFVTSAIFDGNLDGAAGADAKCNAAAATANLPGTFHSLVTDKTLYLERIGAGPWYDVANHLIFSGPVTAPGTGAHPSIAMGLTPEQPLTLDEKGSPQTGFAWTASGSASCSFWTISTSGQYDDGDLGQIGDPGSGWATATFQKCNLSNHLYCFEQ